MNQKFSFRAIQQGQTQQSHVVNAGAGQNGQALVVRAVAGMRYQLADLLTLTSPKKLQLKRVGQDLMVALPGNDVTSPDIVIKDYFNFKDLSLSGLAASGEPMVYDTSSSFNIGQSATGITPESLAANKTTAATLATASGGWFDGGMGLAALGGGGLLLAAAAGGGGSDSTTNAGLTKITTYKGDATKSVPTVTDFATAGVTGVDASNITGILTLFSRTQLPLDSAASLQTLVDSFKKIVAEANGTSADATTEDPSATDYVNLMGANTPNSINTKPQALALLNDLVKALNTTDVDSYSEVKALADAVETIAVLAQTAASTTGTAATTGNITAAQLTSLGVESSDAKAANLSAYSDAIRASADDLSGLNTTAKLTALVKAYNTILDEANGTTADNTTNPTAADYATIGADIGTAKTDTAALDRLNKIVGNLTTTAVDTVGEITKLAATLDKIQTVAAATGTGEPSAEHTFTAEELRNLGLNGFAITNLEGQNTALATAVSAAIRDKAVADVVAGDFANGKLDTTGTRITWSQTQLERLQTLVSQEIIKNYVVDTNTTANTTLAPTATDWTNVGLFSARVDGSGKFDALTATQIGYLNTAVAVLPAASVDTTTKLEAIFAAYVRIVKEANGSTADADSSSNPSVIDYTSIGIGIGDTSKSVTTGTLKMLNDLVAVRSSTDVDSVNEIQVLANLVDKVYTLAALNTGAALGSTQMLTATELITLLGANALTSSTTNNDNLANKISEAIRDKDPADLGAGDFTNGKLHATDGTRITWSQTPIERLQTLVSLETIKNYVVVPATDTTATTTQLPTPTDWSNVGVFHNPATNTDTAMTAWTGLTSKEIIALNSVVDKLLPTASTLATTSELQLLVDAYARVLQEANGSGETNGDKNTALNPSHEDMARLGLTGTAAIAGNTFNLLRDVIANRSSDDVDTFTELKALADTAAKIVEAAGNADVTNFTQDELSKAGLLSNTNATLNAAGLAYLEAQFRALNDGTLVDTVAEVKAQFGLALVRAWAFADDNNTADSVVTKDPFKPTVLDYANFTSIQRLDRITVLSPTSGSSFTLTQHDVDALNTVLDNLPDASFDNLTKLKTVAESLFRVLNEANGSAADANITTAGTAVQQDYINIGLTGMVTTDAGAAKLLNSVVSNQTYTADNAGETSGVDTWTELQKLSTTTDKFLKYADNVSGAVAPDSTDFSLMGITGVVSTYNLTNILSKIDTANAAGIDTFDEIQSLVSHQRIIDFATDATVSNTAGAPTFADWSSLRIAEGSDLTDELAANVTVYNKAVEYKVATGVDQLSELQTLVIDYNAYVTDWSTRVETVNMGTATDLFHSLTTGNQTSANATLVGKLIDLAERSNGSATTNTSGAPYNFTGTDLTKADLTALGLSTALLSNGTNDTNEINNIWVAIQNSNPSEINSLSAIQGIINVWAV